MTAFYRGLCVVLAAAGLAACATPEHMVLRARAECWLQMEKSGRDLDTRLKLVEQCVEGKTGRTAAH